MSYRDEEDALVERLKSLEDEKAHLEGTRRSLEDTDGKLESIEVELTDVRERIAGERRSPLDDLRVAAPCKADWDAMVGDDKVRFCGDCQLNVYNVSAMSKSDAESLIREKEGKLCLRMYRRQDGTVITSDCPVGVTKRRRRRVVAGALVAAGTGLTALWASQPDTFMAPSTHSVGVVQGAEGYFDSSPVPIMGSVAPSVEPAPKPPKERAHSPVGR